MIITPTYTNIILINFQYNIIHNVIFSHTPATPPNRENREICKEIKLSFPLSFISPF